MWRRSVEIRNKLWLFKINKWTWTLNRIFQISFSSDNWIGWGIQLEVREDGAKQEILYCGFRISESKKSYLLHDKGNWTLSIHQILVLLMLLSRPTSAVAVHSSMVPSIPSRPLKFPFFPSLCVFHSDNHFQLSQLNFHLVRVYFSITLPRQSRVCRWWSVNNRSTSFSTRILANVVGRSSLLLVLYNMEMGFACREVPRYQLWYICVIQSQF